MLDKRTMDQVIFTRPYETFLTDLADKVFDKFKLQQVEVNIKKQTEPEKWFDMQMFCDYHPDKPSRHTVYGWIQKDFVPHYKSGKKLRFLKSEIDTWLQEGRKKTISEIAQETDQYLSQSKKA